MIRSPYQQNINIMKGFFRKPIVLTLSIFTFLTVVFQVTVSIINPFITIANSYLDSYLGNIGASNINVKQTASPGISLFSSVSFSSIITILFAVAFLLLYLQSKQEKANLSAPSTIFKVISIINLIIVALLTLISAAVTAILFIIATAMNAEPKFAGGSTVESMFTLGIVLCLTLIPICIMLLLESIGQLLFANSIKSSLTSIYLKRKGAVLYGVTEILIAAYTIAKGIFIIIFILIYNSQYTAIIEPLPITLIIMQMLFTAAASVIMGVLAFKYSSYIKKISQKFRIEIPDEPAKIENNEQPAFNSAPVAAPAFNNNFNPYDTAPSPAPQAEIPQAPVREDFAQQPIQPFDTPDVIENTVEPAEVVAEQAPVVEAPQVEEIVPEQAPVVEAPQAENIQPQPTEEAPQKVIKENYLPRFCTECGNPVKPGDHYCNNCGKEVFYDL